MPLHCENPEDSFIDKILSALTPVNSVSRTNSIASSDATLVSSESSGPTHPFTIPLRLCNWKEEPQSRIANLIGLPIRGAGQRIETWPRVSGDRTCTLGFQEAIRLSRSALDFPERGHLQLPMARQDPVSSNDSCRGGDSHEVPGAIHVHAPLAIRQQTFLAQNEATSDLIVPQYQTNKHRSCHSTSSLSAHTGTPLKQNDLSANNSPHDARMVLQEHLDGDLVSLSLPQSSEKEGVTVYDDSTLHGEFRELTGKDSETIIHTEHNDGLLSLSNLEDNAKYVQDTSSQISKSAGKLLRNTHPRLGLTALEVASSQDPQITFDQQVPSYRPRLGCTSPRAASYKSHIGRNAADQERSERHIVSSIAATTINQHDLSVILPQTADVATSSTSERCTGNKDHSIRHDHGAKRSSCHEL